MTRNSRSFFLSVGLLFLILVGVSSFVEERRPGFSIDKICSPFGPRPKWAIAPLSEIDETHLREILSQDFNYLGSGAECYAFQSADCKYVLKFFRTKHLIPKTWLKWIPLPGLAKYRFRKIDKRILRHEELFSSYKMAYDNLKEETGLVYIHLNKSKDLKVKTQLYDRTRKSYQLKLDRYEFILQKKSQLVHERLTALMQRGDKAGAQRAIGDLLEHVILQCKKGFIDRDSGVNHNYGFVGENAIHFDVGRIIRDEDARLPAHYQREVLRVGKKLETWLSRYYPELLPALEEKITSILDPSSPH